MSPNDLFPRTGGIHALTFEAEDFGTLRYSLSLPDEFSPEPAAAYPFVMALHYGFDRNAPFPAYYGRGLLEGLVLPALGSLDAVIVAPDSHGRYWTDADIGPAVSQLAESLIHHYPIDPARTLLTGFSLGGMGTWHLMGQMPNPYRAAISVAAAPAQAAVDAFPARPLYVIHSDADEVFPIEKVDAAVSAVRERGIEVSYQRVEGLTHYNVPGFIPALSQAREWLGEAWRAEAN